ncbi:unnamed protein product [Kuraishia capsulata CBS 1993]|uniref:ADP-ribosylation factor-like protein 2 n=1 Tax=Kuraishia capsulata CBS 1993 TaxID=1382522 RepID=W6MJL2_9ASCO|nr:uncharacterized protein KUCA_T00002139001 [Kuraishia capsulata CBS 1993]CDK26168.1 unnamed protein product [Kuraishia capsulata CBS 1993]
MGLLSVIRKQKLKDKEIRVLMLGLDNAGKTTIVKNLLSQDLDSISPTMGFSIETLPWKGYTLQVWDIGGQSTLRPFWFNYFERTDCLIWVIDASSLERLSESFKELADILGEERLVGVNLLILVNKMDLAEGLQIDQLRDQIATNLNLKALRSEWKISGVSGITGQNLSASMDWLVDCLKERYIL